MAREFVAVTAMGRDRVGLADDIATWIVDSGANVEESKMAVLGGEFAVIMLVSGSSRSTDALVSGAENFAAALGIHLDAKPTTPPHAAAGGRPYIVESVSLDSPGIVHALTKEIRELGISVEDLETSASAAPFTGAPVFKMKATVILPAKLPVADFREHMERVAHEKDLDIKLDPV